jgi:hypothetical protein
MAGLGDRERRARVKEGGMMSFEARFPIVATNLRTLVGSWLPPAREPSPVDEEREDAESAQGRQERYRPYVMYC